MPYALCPMPYALCQIVPHVTEKGYTSILILTGNHSDADVVALFDAGSDDCISKPCTSEVLLARMRTLLRRSVALSAGGTAKHSSFTLTWRNLCLDMDSGRVTFGEQVIKKMGRNLVLLGRLYKKTGLKPTMSQKMC